PWPLLRRDELQHVARRHLNGLLSDDRKEDRQVVRVRTHRVRPHTSVRELQELVDLVVAHTPRPTTISTRHALKRRKPRHHTPPDPTNTCRRRLPRRSAQKVDHPYKCRSGARHDTARDRARNRDTSAPATTRSSWRSGRSSSTS